LVARIAKLGMVTNGHVWLVALAWATMLIWSESIAVRLFSMDAPIPSKSFSASPEYPASNCACSLPDV
jgi:hypothetical protein